MGYFDEERPCAACRHWQVIPPAGWEPSDYSPHEQCDLADWRNHVRKTSGGDRKVVWYRLTGECRKYPTPLKRVANETCGLFEMNFTAFRPVRLLEEFFDNSESWAENRNKELRQELKRSRNLSAKRMARIKELEGKLEKA